MIESGFYTLNTYSTIMKNAKNKKLFRIQLRINFSSILIERIAPRAAKRHGRSFAKDITKQKFQY